MVHNVSGYDLIDTLWNVKVEEQMFIEQLEFDLIDTLWNVKSEDFERAASVALAI